MIEMDWAKPVAQSALVALIFIRWLRTDGRREPRWGSAIYDRCDAEAGERHFVEREKKMKKTTSGRDGWVGWGLERTKLGVVGVGGEWLRCQRRAEKKKSAPRTN